MDTIPYSDSCCAVYLQGTSEEQALVQDIYERIRREGTANRVFYDGSIQSAEAFVELIFQSGTLPFLVFLRGEPAAFIWVNGVEGRAGRGHFVLFRNAWGREQSRCVGRFMFAWLLSQKDADGYLFDVIVGVTPASNVLARKWVLECGAEQVGVLPYFAFMARTGTTEDAIITAATRDSLRRQIL